MTPARVLVADPPWRFGDRLPGPKRGASKHYGCMTTADICGFVLPALAPDCLLFMWRVSAMQREALDVVAAWGFRLHSELVWRKLTRGRPCKEHFGMGRIVRGAHETCLIGVRGRPPIKSHSVRSVFSAQVGEHSAKPDAFYALVEQLSDGPYAELFARRHRPGWACYGDQLPANDNMRLTADQQTG